MKTFKTFAKEAYSNRRKSSRNDADMMNIFNAAKVLPFDAFLIFLNDDYTIIKN